MGVRILLDRDRSSACLYCSTSGWAFGPVFGSDASTGEDAEEVAERFLAWLKVHKPGDPRRLSEAQMVAAYTEWVREDDARPMCDCGSRVDLRACEECGVARCDDCAEWRQAGDVVTCADVKSCAARGVGAR